MEVFRDENGKVSTTRVTILTCLALFSGIVVCDLSMGAQVNQEVYNILMAIFSFGLGGQAVRASVKNAKA